MRGLGDVIARIARFLGLDRIAKKVASLFGNEDCGCERRQLKLNKLIPFKNNDKAK